MALMCPQNIFPLVFYANRCQVCVYKKSKLPLKAINHVLNSIFHGKIFIYMYIHIHKNTCITLCFIYTTYDVCPQQQQQQQQQRQPQQQLVLYNVYPTFPSSLVSTFDRNEMVKLRLKAHNNWQSFIHDFVR
jgi:flagellar basal body-associated protein FliL